MNNFNVDATQMLWQPELLELTAIEMVGMPAHVCYINPQHIEYIIKYQYDLKENNEKLKSGIGTCIKFFNGSHIVVLEEPEYVAKLRNKAFGFK